MRVVVGELLLASRWHRLPIPPRIISDPMGYGPPLLQADGVYGCPYNGILSCSHEVEDPILKLCEHLIHCSLILG